MGKKQHQKDKMYLTATEWSTLYGGKKTDSQTGQNSGFRRLPFNHCALSLQPFEHPLCDADGNIFDLMSIIPFIKKFKKNPITGQPLEAKSLIRLNITKNNEGHFHCPVLYKTFTDNSHIVAITTTGNVFSYEAVEQLNLKPKNWCDLLTDEPFARKDIITLQDPANLSKFNLATFHHVKHNLKVEDEELVRAGYDPAARLKSPNLETRDTLEELNRQYKAPDKKEEVAKKADKFNAAWYSKGAVAAGFTSTVMEPTTEHEAAIVEEDVVRYQRVKKKGYVRIVTNCGPLNLEIHCDMVPRTCENFMKLSQKGYYDGTLFHRSIRNFMIQGGDPIGTGKGGESHWGKPFKDEFKPNLSHTGRGILSMANSGPNTNKSQFFITYRSCKHLDGKHTIFGRVVGGLETLNAVESIEVDNKDRPIEDIVIEKCQVFVDPFQEADEQLALERAEERKKKAEEEAAMKELPSKKRKSEELQVYRKGIGKYINLEAEKEVAKKLQKTDEFQKKKTAGYSFGSFSSW